MSPKDQRPKVKLEEAGRVQPTAKEVEFESKGGQDVSLSKDRSEVRQSEK